MAHKVLVLCGTGKVGRNTTLALKEAGFEVYATTRSSQNTSLASKGIKPIIANYTDRTDLDRALSESGAKKVLMITDYFLAAKNSTDREFEQGKTMIEAAKAAQVEHLIFISVVDADRFPLVGKATPDPSWPSECHHIKAKRQVEEYLIQNSSNITYSILRPCAFFENLDDAANYNPLKRGAVKFLMTENIKWCSTFDIGRAAAVQFKNSSEWNKKILDVVSWEGSLADVAAALEKVGGVKVNHGLAMPIFARKMFLSDLHHMCLYFANGNPAGRPDDFKKVVPGAFTAEDWFRWYNKYADGTPIVAPPGYVYPKAGMSTIKALLLRLSYGILLKALLTHNSVPFACRCLGHFYSRIQM